jgi:hypothetical protein
MVYEEQSKTIFNAYLRCDKNKKIIWSIPKVPGGKDEF